MRTKVSLKLTTRISSSTPKTVSSSIRDFQASPRHQHLRKAAFPTPNHIKTELQMSDLEVRGDESFTEKLMAELPPSVLPLGQICTRLFVCF